MPRAWQWRTCSDGGRGRRRALRAETQFWRDWLRARGGTYADEYAYRFDPAAEVADPVLRLVLAALEQDAVSILDVGAGPASMVGRRLNGRPVDVTAVDPLADEYDRLLEEFGAVPPVRTERAAGEELVERFGHDRFDVAYARNAIDHAVDPAEVIDNMLAVVRPGGEVVLRHMRNEGERQAYAELHQWNFDERDGRLLVWRAGQTTNITERLSGRGTVGCWRAQTDDGDMIVGRIRKLPPARRTARHE